MCKGGIELGKALDIIIGESITAGKPISAELREDTSYLMMLRLKEKGLIEQIGEDEMFLFGREYDTTLVTEAEQAEILSRRNEIKQAGQNSTTTRMHKFTFRPTEKYKRRLQDKAKRREKRNVSDMEV